MDRKSAIVLLACFLLLMLWYPAVNHFFPPVPLPKTNTVSRLSPTNHTGVTAPTAASNETVIASNRGASNLPPMQVEGPEQLVVLENENAIYTFTSIGGGLKSVALKHYAANVTCDKKQRAASTNYATLNSPAPVAAFALVGPNGLLAKSGFQLTRDGDSVRAEYAGSNGLRIVKEYRLGTNYLLQAHVRLENQSNEPLPIPALEWVIGAATPIGRRDETLSLGSHWYNGRSDYTVNQAWFANRTFGCLPGTTRDIYLAGESNVVWAAVNNQFFTMIAEPKQPAPQIVSRRVDLPAPSLKELEANPKWFAHPFGYQTALLYPAVQLSPGQNVQRDYQLYAGPKKYNTLSRLGANEDLVMGFGGFFGFFAKALLLSMNGLAALGISYGLTIIVITVVIKLLFWPLTQASTQSMKRMQALQPQMKALQEKYKDDPKKMQMKLMEFMKENKVSPLGGCLPMLLQIPVFLGFYRMLQSAIELRGASFLWACDLSQPDTVAMLPGLNFPINPLPLLMGVTMLWQSSLTPPSPGVDPMQQKMMRYMPLMFMVFLYNFSAGLTLYWTVQNLLTIAQMKLTKASGGAPGAGPPATPGGPRQMPPKKKF